MSLKRLMGWLKIFKKIITWFFFFFSVCYLLATKHYVVAFVDWFKSLILTSFVLLLLLSGEGTILFYPKKNLCRLRLLLTEWITPEVLLLWGTEDLRAFLIPVVNNQTWKSHREFQWNKKRDLGQKPKLINMLMMMDLSLCWYLMWELLHVSLQWWLQHSSGQSSCFCSYPGPIRGFGRAIFMVMLLGDY